jgi:error-prone DNA polymerase
LCQLKRLSVRTRERLVAERGRGEFASLADFLSRVAPDAAERRALARAGALNGLPEVAHRRQAMWQVELPLHDDLWGASGAVEDVLPAMSPGERLAADLATQGASIGPHPMALWRREAAVKLARASELRHFPPGMPVRVGGLVICRQRPGTAKGHCFISLEDETGIANLFVPKKTFQRLRRVIACEPFLMAEGRVQVSEGDQPTVYVTQIVPLPGREDGHAARSHDFH